VIEFFGEIVPEYKNSIGKQNVKSFKNEPA
jgi:hypothetical protein